jgi:hypothetical protein
MPSRRKQGSRSGRKLLPVNEKSLLAASEAVLQAYRNYLQNRSSSWENTFFTDLSVKVNQLFDLVESFGLYLPTLFVDRSIAADIIRVCAGEMYSCFHISGLLKVPNPTKTKRFGQQINALEGAVGMLRSPTTARPPQHRKRDKETEARDKWIYVRCCKAVPYKQIISDLQKKHPRWEAITTKQGIFACARKYAADNELANPPPRQTK